MWPINAAYSINVDEKRERERKKSITRVDKRAIMLTGLLLDCPVNLCFNDNRIVRRRLPASSMLHDEILRV